MLAPASPEAPPASTPACPGLLRPEQPFGSITLPLLLSGSLRLIPEQFAELCQANPDAVLELAAAGSLICMTPTRSDTGARNAELSFQIKTWARATGGWKAFDSSTGFRLPDNCDSPCSLQHSFRPRHQPGPRRCCQQARGVSRGRGGMVQTRTP
jgi:hypothetical protein